MARTPEVEDRVEPAVPGLVEVQEPESVPRLSLLRLLLLLWLLLLWLLLLWPLLLWLLPLLGLAKTLSLPFENNPGVPGGIFPPFAVNTLKPIYAS